MCTKKGYGLVYKKFMKFMKGEKYITMQFP